MLKILSQLRPRRVIVVHGTEEATQAVAKHCEQNIGARVFTPHKGEVSLNYNQEDIFLIYTILDH